MARRPPVGFLLGVLVAGLVLFLVPSAWLFSRGVPYVLCWLGGALVFPLLPVGWHLLAERKRTRAAATAAASAKGPPRPAATSTLTSVDRFTMRLALVALVALGPLLFFRFGQTWRAVRDHATWFIPEPPPAPRDLTGDPRLLAQVPGDAELVVWMRGIGAMQAELQPGEKRSAEQPDEALAAFRDGHVMIVVRGRKVDVTDKQLAELNQQIAKQGTWMPVQGKLVARKRGKDLVVLVSEGWAAAADDRDAGKSNGPTAIIERLNGAPPDAYVIAAASPSRPVAGLTVSGAQSWLRVSRKDIRLDGEIYVADRTAAAAVVAAVRLGQKDLEGRAPEDCRRSVATLMSRVIIDSSETSVRVSARWNLEEVGEAMMCGLAAAMEDAEWTEVE